MGNLFILVGVVYSAALFIQMLAYKQSVRKAALEHAKVVVGDQGAVACEGC